MAAVRTRDERVREAAALSAVGGFLDAYTYLVHGGVFANAQTGNVVLFGVEAALGRWDAALRHVPPVLAFIAGLVTVEALGRLRSWRSFAHPARIVLSVECCVFALVAVTPMPSVLAVVLIAFASTLQVSAFRQVHAITYATTFTTGNLRSLIAQSASWLVDRDAAARARALALLAIVGSFAAGAVLGGLSVRWVRHWALLFVIPVLLAVLASIVVGTTRLRRDG